MATQPEVVVAAVAGVLSFASPCMIPVVPAFVARMGGLTPDERSARHRTFVHALLFVLGFSLVFAALGVAFESVLSGATTEVRVWLARAAGVFIVGFGLHLAGLIELSVFRDGATLPTLDRQSGLLASLLVGGAFAVAWTPCVGPVLGSAFALAAAEPTAAFPVMVAYSLGLGAPFLLVALVPNRARALLSGGQRTAERFRSAFGVLLLALGVLVFTRQLNLLGTVVYAQEALG